MNRKTITPYKKKAGYDSDKLPITHRRQSTFEGTLVYSVTMCSEEKTQVKIEKK